jgi:hypothetical protein
MGKKKKAAAKSLSAGEMKKVKAGTRWSATAATASELRPDALGQSARRGVSIASKRLD